MHVATVGEREKERKIKRVRRWDDFKPKDGKKDLSINVRIELLSRNKMKKEYNISSEINKQIRKI